MTTVAMLLERPRRARVVLSAIAGAIAFGICWVVGMDYWHSGSLAVVVFVAGVVWSAVPEHIETRMQKESPAPSEGVRREVIDLSWALRRQRGGIRDSAFRRIRALALRRLGTERLDLDDPRDGERIAARIGRPAYEALASPSGSLSSLRSVTRSLDALDELTREGP